jgi:small subunit ribosomal protein S18
MSEERNPTAENKGANGDPTVEATADVTPAVTLASEADTSITPGGAEEVLDPEDEGSAEEMPIVEVANGSPGAEVEADEVVEEEMASPVAISAATERAPAPAPAQAAGPAPTQTAGPKEYTPEYEVGGRSRRIHIEVRLDEINYKNVALLGRFLDPRGRILSRRKTRVSAKVQRRVVNAIKLARHVALLPYTSDQTRIVRRRR